MALWASARFDLKLSDGEFHRLTFRELAALLERHTAQEQRADYRAGVVASILANQWRDKKHKAAKPADFFPSLGSGSSNRIPLSEMEPDKQSAMLNMLASLYGGKVAKAAG